MNRTHLILAIIIAILAPALLMAQDADVVYLEGFPTLRSGGATRDLDFGLVIRPGDSVVTGRRDFAELDQAGNSIRINSDTVFTVREIERDGRRETVLTNTVGSVAFRFQTLAGRQQQVGTATAVAGVRGTEFTVYAGSDGSSLFGVDSGLITVESAGVGVDVAAGQAVEVRAGEAPGDVIRWIGPELDFSTWDQERVDSFLDDPITSLQRLQTRMRDFIANGAAMYEIYLESWAELQEAEAERGRIRDRDGAAAADAFFQATVAPRVRQTLIHVLNYRFYDVSALSLRRFVYSRMYISMKTRYWNDLQNPAFQEFLSSYRSMLDEFETSIAVRLDPEDI